MSKPYIHALSSAKKFGGIPEDYMPIHEMMDSSKSVMADDRHRVFFHCSFGIFILTKIFGETFVNSAGKTVSTRDIGEQHCIEDYGGFIPSAQDFLGNMSFEGWMRNGTGGLPPSMAKLEKKKTTKINWSN